MSLLSKALKSGASCPTPRAPAVSALLKIASPNHSTPVGSFNEDSLFEHSDANPAPASRYSAAGPATNVVDFPIPEAAEDPSPWFTDGFDDDEDCSGLPQHALAVAITSKEETHESAGARLQQSPGWGFSEMNTTSAPTISSTLSSHQAETRRSSFKTALSAVTMGPLGILEENEAFISPAVTEFPLPRMQPYCSSLPLSRCRSMPRPITPNDGGALTSATSAEGDPCNSQSSSIQRHHRTTIHGSPRSSTEFRPPHEIAAASFSESPGYALQPSMTGRHKSIADRLKAQVFEQTGLQPHSCGRGFLA